jgi:coniferyl-aldehyde dehydrogenase
MSILESSTSTSHPSSSPPTAGDGAAIAELHATFKAQRAAFHADRQPSLDERRARIGRLVEMLLGNRERISAALSADFGCHPVPASDLIEVLGPVGRAKYVLERLEEWMRPSAREVDPAVLGSATAYIQYQPKGVVGNIVPWNFPFDLSVGPMIEMLAAGNRVMVKPSEFTPASAALLRDMVSRAFDPSSRARSRSCPGITCSTPAARTSAARSCRPRRAT